MKRFALRLTADPGEAEDLSQEALLRAYRSWVRIRGEDPGPYVRRTIVNLYRSMIRRKALESRYRQAARPELTSSHEHGVEQSVRIGSALRCLSPVGRATVILRFYEDLPQAEIARILDRPIGTVKSDLHRALARLRSILNEESREPRCHSPRRGPRGGRPRSVEL